MKKRNEIKTLNLYPIDYPFETLVSRIRSIPPKLSLSPEFQRKYKWDKEGWERASKFIESCLMRIPLPSCYFAEEDNGKQVVIDGVQRLTTIVKFFNDEFCLEGLSTFKELEGKKFSQLGNYKTELETTTIRCIVLRNENPKFLVREIFSRLNQGAVQLSGQEVRHAVYPGSLDGLLLELSKEPTIANFGVGKKSSVIRNSREAEEQVLRFFAINDNPNGHTSSFNSFLDDYMDKNSNISDAKIKRLRLLFKRCLKNCELVFNDEVFYGKSTSKAKQGLVYYDLLMNTVGVLDDKIINSKIKQKKIREAFKKLCESAAFKRTLSGGLQKQSSVKKRRELWADLLKKVTDG